MSVAHEVPYGSTWHHLQHRTQPCAELLQTGACPAGDACEFAHSPAELRPRPLPTRQLRAGLADAGWQQVEDAGQPQGLRLPPAACLLLPGHLPCWSAAAAPQPTHPPQPTPPAPPQPQPPPGASAASGGTKRRRQSPGADAADEEEQQQGNAEPGATQEGQRSDGEEAASEGGRPHSQLGGAAERPRQHETEETAAAAAQQQGMPGPPPPAAAEELGKLRTKLQLLELASDADAARLRGQLAAAQRHQERAQQEAEELRGKLAAAVGAGAVRELEAQVEALEEDLQQKDASWMELQSRWGLGCKARLDGK